jgi:hypothetical protein
MTTVTVAAVFQLDTPVAYFQATTLFNILTLSHTKTNTNQKMIMAVKARSSPKSNPPQLYLLEEWNTRTSLDVLKSHSQPQEAVMGDNPDSHEKLAFIRYRALDRNFVSVLVFCFRHIEYGEDRRGNNENRGIDKVTSRTEPLANAKR